MELDNIDPERRALYGFSYGFTGYRGWFDILFDEYTLYPYLNLLKQETKDLLYKKHYSRSSYRFSQNNSA